jgi:hypothetical protein
LDGALVLLRAIEEFVWQNGEDSVHAHAGGSEKKD